MNVLILDDDEGVRESFALIVKISGWQWRVSDSPEEAMEIMGGNEIDLFTTDLRIGGKSAYEACDTFRRRGIFIPGILITANRFTVDLKLAAKVGLCKIISKPPYIAEFREALVDAMDMRERCMACLREQYASLVGK